MPGKVVVVPHTWTEDLRVRIGWIIRPDNANDENDVKAAIKFVARIVETMGKGTEALIKDENDTKVRVIGTHLIAILPAAETKQGKIYRAIQQLGDELHSVVFQYQQGAQKAPNDYNENEDSNRPSNKKINAPPKEPRRHETQFCIL